MRAIRMHEYGGPEVLRCEEVALPEPGAGEARVKIEAVGVNYIDIYQRKGQYPDPLPVIPGREAAGVIDAVGPGVSDLTPGTRVVYAMHVGAYSEYAVVPARRLVPIPDAIDVRLAAAVMLQGLTAHYLTHSTYPLQPGDCALIHAAAGGVGLLLIQMAKRRGARVIGTVSTEEKAHLAREAGADEVILYTQADFDAETRRLTDGRGVHVVYDSVGQDTFDKSLNCLSPRGCMVLYGQSSGPVPPFNPQVLSAKGSVFLTRPNLMHYTLDRAELLKRAGDLFEWITAGTLTVRIDATFPLSEAAVAHRCLEERKTKGKVLLIP
ncbi:MAG: quinone oxidoreductase [Candidatus Methylomirabilis oxygeniifera]|uniref:Quinone oxidoreductase (NADPH:quinone reductase) n=1 Tax=Methylomirabilis oxygeniifera TaxID=671143 RepID=D5MHB6_METO1|nr:MAG: quinone oxidoreductase [Candidatus Methylomirabilis oxyfera]CBE69148.1 Quinone oxidoreductase (NADPH:quinone reductase) [Candidatus Methylomirabilis oxyfera]